MGVRAVPHAVARYGAFLGRNVVLMPSYVNIGAYVDEGTMVDTWATVGSCAQIGKHVHLSGGVGIGGVLEPLQASPVVIEDGCFIGSRSIVVEGVRVCKEAVLGANVVLTQSTKIIDDQSKENYLQGHKLNVHNIGVFNPQLLNFSELRGKRKRNKSKEKDSKNELKFSPNNHYISSCPNRHQIHLTFKK
jgi:2,3,4,5-tetrahydropyridine-2,6-dicarboxylate N-succinyltransferase